MYRRRIGNGVRKLVERIEKDFGVKCDLKSFSRSYRGYWGVRRGEWSWSIKTVAPENECEPKTIGSICTVTEINKSKAKLVVFECWGSMIEICLDE